MTYSKCLRAVLLGGAAVIAAAGTAHAAAPAANSTDAIAQRLADLQAQIEELNNTVADLKRGQSAQYADVQKQRSGDVQVSIKNGRPTFKSADGNFSLAIRALVQYDAAYYSGGGVPTGIDLSSGTNFRRARAGVSGTLFGNWSYEFIYDFGASGTETSAISSAYIQYDGLGPVHIKAGAYAPPGSIEDSTSASDLMFLERSQPTDLTRSIAGADGRDAATIFAYDDDYFASVSYTNGVVNDLAVFDEQQAIIGNAVYRIYGSTDANWIVGANTSYAFDLADTLAGPKSPTAFRLRERPELNVDSTNTRLIDTGAIDTQSVWEWGVETAGNWQNFYAQGGYFGFEITRRDSLLDNPSFNGWYLQGSWVITGESKTYKPERGAYGLPTPEHPLSLDQPGAGAWEVTARYSDLDLNYHPGAEGTIKLPDAIRGGDQRIWTAGINWYPNSAIRFVLDYQHTDVSRLNAAGLPLLDAKVDTIALRTQLSL